LGEHQLDKLGVTGSSPVPPTRTKALPLRGFSRLGSQAPIRPRTGRGNEMATLARPFTIPRRSMNHEPDPGHNRGATMIDGGVEFSDSVEVSVVRALN
jgi:hypothetical protein